MGRGAHNIHVVNAACVNGMCVGLKVISDVFYLRTAQVRRHRIRAHPHVSLVGRRAGSGMGGPDPCDPRRCVNPPSTVRRRGWSVRIRVNVNTTHATGPVLRAARMYARDTALFLPGAQNTHAPACRSGWEASFCVGERGGTRRNRLTDSCAASAFSILAALCETAVSRSVLPHVPRRHQLTVEKVVPDTRDCLISTGPADHHN